MDLAPNGGYAMAYERISGSKIQDIIALVEQHGVKFNVSYYDEHDLLHALPKGGKTSMMFEYRVFIGAIAKSKIRLLDSEIKTVLES